VRALYVSGSAHINNASKEALLISGSAHITESVRADTSMIVRGLGDATNPSFIVNNGSPTDTAVKIDGMNATDNNALQVIGNVSILSKRVTGGTATDVGGNLTVGGRASV